MDLMHIPGNLEESCVSQDKVSTRALIHRACLAYPKTLLKRRFPGSGMLTTLHKKKDSNRSKLLFWQPRDKIRNLRRVNERLLYHLLKLRYVHDTRQRRRKQWICIYECIWVNVMEFMFFFNKTECTLMKNISIQMHLKYKNHCIFWFIMKTTHIHIYSCIIYHSYPVIFCDF